MKPGDVVWIRAFDEVPRHRFRVLEVREDQITGIALSGPLAGCYGEPDRVMVEPLTPETPTQGTPVSL